MWCIEKYVQLGRSDNLKCNSINGSCESQVITSITIVYREWWPWVQLSVVASMHGSCESQVITSITIVYCECCMGPIKCSSINAWVM